MSARPPSFDAYVDELRELAVRAGRAGLEAAERARTWAELDGNASRVFRRRVALDIRRDEGTFFTGHTLAARLVAPQAGAIREGASVCDPACGLGDLLLAAARHLPIVGTLAETLELWGRQLRGHDLRADLVSTTKVRLYLLAMARGAEAGVAPHPDEAFPLITVGDFFEVDHALEARVLLLNPPYGRVQAPDSVDWARGSVSEAAIFAEHALEKLGDDSRFCAILPDVLRSGSRYQAWRERVESLARPTSITPMGQFHPTTDVDVFLLRARRNPRARGASWWPPPPEAATRVQDLFDVSVGAVVPHRHADEGSEIAYVYARLLPATGVYTVGTVRRGFDGTTVRPPFVAIRRTCRPVKQGSRVLASIVAGKEPVAVENHLLVARPHSGTLSDCRRLVTLLSSQETSDWLDQRIRCRHLTVGAVQQLPWPDA